MKRTFILSAVAMLTLVVTVSSCGPGRSYYSQTPPPRYNTNFSLIISPTPGFTMNRHPDGRYYHRSPQGFIYWQGYDNRFYLDRQYINRVQYNKWEYSEWKHYRNSDQRGRRR
jgi:hypothetical protein